MIRMATKMTFVIIFSPYVLDVWGVDAAKAFDRIPNEAHHRFISSANVVAYTSALWLERPLY